MQILLLILEGQHLTFFVAWEDGVYLTVTDLETLQTDLDEYMNRYNTDRTHQGKRCKGRTPIETFYEGKNLYIVKIWITL